MTNLTPSEARRLIDKLHHNQTKEHGISILEEKYLAALEIALPVLEGRIASSALPKDVFDRLHDQYLMGVICSKGNKSAAKDFLDACVTALPVLEQQESKRQVTLREAVSEIRKLTEESGGYNFAALRAEQDNSEWISCSDRTPEPLDWVIAYDEVGTVKAYICQRTGEWIRDNGDELYQVTHWQPLPSPPEDA